MLSALAIVPAVAQKPACAKQGAKCATEAQQQRLRPYNTGVGPVMSATVPTDSLPAQATAFIKEIFPGATVTEVENEFAKRCYDVDLSNGYDVKFDYSGNWVEIDAPDGATLPSSTLSALVPEEAVMTTLAGDALLNGGVVDAVEEIYAFPEGYVVEYVTGTVGKGHAAVARSDGSILKQPKGVRNPRSDKAMRHAKHAKYASPVNLHNK